MNIFRYIIYICIFFLLTFRQNSFADVTLKSNEIFNLDEKNILWHFKANDDITNSNIDVDLTTWTKLCLIDEWRTIKKFKNYKGLGWYRISLSIREQRDYALFIPRTNKGIQIYINGSFIAETRPFIGFYTPSICGIPGVVEIPKEKIKPGANILALRVGELDGFSGITIGLRIGPTEKINRFFVLYLIWYSALSFISLFLFLYYLFFFFHRRNDTYYLYYSLFALLLGIWVLGWEGLILYLHDSHILFLISTYAGGILSPVMLIGFIHSFFKVKKNIMYWIINSAYIIYLMAFILNYIINGNVLLFNMYMYDFFSLSNILVVIYCLVILSQGVLQKKPYSLTILIGVSGLGLSVFLSMLYFINILNISPHIIEGFFFLTISLASALASNFSRVYNNLEETHNNLIDVNILKNKTLENLNIYKNIVSTSRDHMAYIDKNFNFLVVNDAFLKDHCLDRVEAENRPIEHFSKKNIYFKKLKRYLSNCLSGKEVSFEKWTNFEKDKKCYMITTLSPYYSNNGSINGIVYYSIDMTERINFQNDMVKISENERNLIGMELHDVLSQNLLTIAIKTNLISEDLIKTNSSISLFAERITKIGDMLKESIELTRNLARGLFPISIEETGLGAYCVDLKNRIENNYKIRVDLDIDEPLVYDKSVAKPDIYFIIQEAVINAIKHSNTTKVDINLKQKNKFIVMEVRDYGTGFQKNEYNGIGMNIMKYRARMIGANLNIKSIKNKGSIITCILKT